MGKTRRVRKVQRRKSFRKRGGKVLGFGRFGCVVKPPKACLPDKNMSQFVGKLVSSTESQISWDRHFREKYPLLENTEFEDYQREFQTEWEKAEEIRRRIPFADSLYVLPKESCAIPNLYSENVLNCKAKVSENLNTQLILPFAEGNLRELLDSGKEAKGLLEALNQVERSIYILHENRIVHNDIKLENILWGYNAEGVMWCKLADFGIALFFPTRGDENLTSRIEESARSSLSSGSFMRNMSPVLRTPTPTKFIPPLQFGTKKGIVPSLALGALANSPRLQTIRVESEFESMRELDLSAFEGCLALVAHTATSSANINASTR